MKFKVDGEYVTKEARKLFWEDDESYEDVESYLLDFLVCDLPLEELKEIIVSILEGKKKLIGINEFDLIDDNLEIRPITTKLVNIQKKLLIEKIQKDIESNPLKYRDFYALNKSWNYCTAKTIEEVYQYAYTDMSIVAKKVKEIHLQTIDIGGYISFAPAFDEKIDLSKWYDDSEQSFLHHGIYLLYKPELIAELIGEPLYGGNLFEFYEKLYEYWEKSEDNKNPEVIERQRRYKKTKDVLKIENTYNKLDVLSENINEKVSPDDNFTSIYGIIDPTGNWYNVDFGRHALRATNIIRNDLQKFDLTEDNSYKDIEFYLDIILNSGWILVRNPDYGDAYLEYKVSIHPTKAQINKIIDYLEFYKLKDIKGFKELMK